MINNFNRIILISFTIILSSCKLFDLRNPQLNNDKFEDFKPIWITNNMSSELIWTTNATIDPNTVMIDTNNGR